MGLEVRELEAFLVLAEELHFGRAGERLYISQGRVSQLLRSLERRIGGRLVDRTSRRVSLTPLGAEFAAELRPAYQALGHTLDRACNAARGVHGLLRIGFQGSTDLGLMAAIEHFQRRYPDCAIDLREIPLADPFGPLYRDEVDVALILTPIREPDLVLGHVFAKQTQQLAVSARHRLACRDSIHAEELAEERLIGFRGPAPQYWRDAHAPSSTPGGRAIPAGPAVRTLEEGLALVATERGAMLLCKPTSENRARPSVSFVPVDGLDDSVLGLCWHRSRETARVRAFADVLGELG
ncbi:LysR family transcriptional regulator [Nocardia arthritidis]|uniref:LysR family transcriptional regulator n=1 Tax=Nocardia arthritidis TaxID=228602 RepID=A0A6G9YNJ6_9NOCA|nr:LysR family transcriptional regulator [Nocardia arthritidis]QIS14700.1 LysR family transcriptional regulator [Nocardia arthritidis]